MSRETFSRTKVTIRRRQATSLPLATAMWRSLHIKQFGEAFRDALLGVQL